MQSDDSLRKNAGLVTGFYGAILEEEKKKLRIAKCPICKKTTFYRLSSLGDAELQCKSCKAMIKVERYENHPSAFR